MLKYSWLGFSIKLLVLYGSSGSTSGIPDREGRLLEAKQITRDQLNKNFQGSASIAIGYSTGVFANYANVWAGVLIAKDTFISTDLGGGGPYREVYVSELTAPYANGAAIVKDPEGEKYTATSGRVPLGAPVLKFTTTKFEPLAQDTKAVVATLPPNGSKPPTPATKGCIAYGFKENVVTDGSDHSTNKLGYLPLNVLDFQICKDIDAIRAQDGNLQFCGYLDSSIQPYCYQGEYLDFPMIVTCPAGTLLTQYNKEGAFIQEREQADTKCGLFSPWWWWWCQDQENPQVPPPVEKPWITVGITRAVFLTAQCGSPPTAANGTHQLTILFSFLGNL